MDMALGSLRYECCLVYMDDIAVKSASFEEHLDHLDLVFDRLRLFNIHVKAEKCLFLQRELLFLGHLVSAEGIRPNPEKVKALRDCPAPRTLRQLRGFIAFCSYFRRFIKGFATHAAPLSALLRKGISFPKTFTEEQIKAMNHLRTALTSDCILSHPDHTRPFEIHTDASNVGLGAVLMQKAKGYYDVIQYMSRSLTPTESRYHIWEKECLAIVWAIRLCRSYVLGTRFVLKTDNKALTTLLRSNGNNRFAKWLIELQEYSFDVVFIPGTQNRADYLSRNPLPSTSPYGEEPVPALSAEDLRSILEDTLPSVRIITKDAAPCPRSDEGIGTGPPAPSCANLPARGGKRPLNPVPLRIPLGQLLRDPLTVFKREQQADSE